MTACCALMCDTHLEKYSSEIKESLNCHQIRVCWLKYASTRSGSPAKWSPWRPTSRAFAGKSSSTTCPEPPLKTDGESPCLPLHSVTLQGPAPTWPCTSVCEGCSRAAMKSGWCGRRLPSPRRPTPSRRRRRVRPPWSQTPLNQEPVERWRRVWSPCWGETIYTRIHAEQSRGTHTTHTRGHLRVSNQLERGTVFTHFVSKCCRSLYPNVFIDKTAWDRQTGACSTDGAKQQPSVVGLWCVHCTLCVSRTMLRYFFPPAFRISKDDVNSMTAEELVAFPLVRSMVLKTEFWNNIWI